MISEQDYVKSPKAANNINNFSNKGNSRWKEKIFS